MHDDLKEAPRKTAGKITLDADRFRQLHRDCHARLVYSVMGILRDRDKAEDIVARAFHIAWEKRGTFRGEALPYTWMYAIARNEALNLARREGKAPTESIDQVDSREIPAPQPMADEVEKREDQARLHKALERLPNLYRTVLTAQFLDGMSGHEIADRERIPHGTVLSRISKGKQLLRDALENSGVRRPGESPDPPTWDR